jgi:ribonuclease T2
MERNLHWQGAGHPYISAVPAMSPGNQPLFGMNQHLQPLYVQEPDASPNCAKFSYGTDFCKQSTRNVPKAGWSPAFVAWPLNTEHVQRLVAFASAHNLCIAVAGTGSDFINRHTCDQGLMIRTSLLKGIEWDLAGDELSVKLGAGLVFSEVMASGAQQIPSVYVAGGWAQTVGVVGWALGGGHGPHGRTHGFGSDNLLEAELVLANGTIAVASSEQNSDLLWALRGGGGSTWGVITSVRYRAHVSPPAGFTVMLLSWNQSMCSDGHRHLHDLLDDYPKWAKKRSTNWNGLALFNVADPFTTDSGCDASWNAVVKYVYRGDKTDDEFLAAKEALTKFHHVDGESIQTYANMWEVLQAKSIAEDYILPIPFPVDDTTIGVPSVEVAEADMGLSFRDNLLDRMNDCKTDGGPLAGIAGVCVSLYHDIPSTNCAEPVAEGSTSVHPAFRSAMIHAMATISHASALASFLKFGESSYFAESTFNMDGWQQRYWGTNYARLLEIKKQVDPTGVFWCHHCVGSEDAYAHHQMLV